MLPLSFYILLFSFPFFSLYTLSSSSSSFPLTCILGSVDSFFFILSLFIFPFYLFLLFFVPGSIELANAILLIFFCFLFSFFCVFIFFLVFFFNLNICLIGILPCYILCFVFRVSFSCSSFLVCFPFFISPLATFFIDCFVSAFLPFCLSSSLIFLFDSSFLVRFNLSDCLFYFNYFP